MAIALDTSAVSIAQTSSPATWNHTVTGSNTLLAVGISTSATLTQPTVTAVTYNGVAMVKARADQNTIAGGIVETSIWLLANPSTGSNVISVTFSGGTGTHTAGTSVSYTGVNQTSTADAVGGTTFTTSGDKTFTVTTVADNCWVFAVGINCASIAPSITPDQTARGSSISLSTGILGTMQASDTNGVVTPAGSKTMGFTVGADTAERGGAMTGASFAPVPLGTFWQTAFV